MQSDRLHVHGPSGIAIAIAIGRATAACTVHGRSTSTGELSHTRTLEMLHAFR